MHTPSLGKDPRGISAHIQPQMIPLSSLGVLSPTFPLSFPEYCGGSEAQAHTLVSMLEKRNKKPTSLNIITHLPHHSPTISTEKFPSVVAGAPECLCPSFSKTGGLGVSLGNKFPPLPLSFWAIPSFPSLWGSFIRYHRLGSL